MSTGLFLVRRPKIRMVRCNSSWRPRSASARRGNSPINEGNPSTRVLLGLQRLTKHGVFVFCRGVLWFFPQNRPGDVRNLHLSGGLLKRLPQASPGRPKDSWSCLLVRSPNREFSHHHQNKTQRVWRHGHLGSLDSVGRATELFLDEGHRKRKHAGQHLNNWQSMCWATCSFGGGVKHRGNIGKHLLV